MLYPKYRHSASSGNIFIEDMAAFVWRWGLQNWGKDAARPAMGKAAEFAAYKGIVSNLSDFSVGRIAQQQYDWLMQGEVAPERSYAVRAAIRLRRLLRGFGPLLAYQPWRGVWVDGLQKQISIKPDFVFQNCMVDAKVTLVLPSSPRWKDIRQQGLYCGAYQMPVKLLYVTPGATYDKRVKKRRKALTHRMFDLTRQDAVVGSLELLTAFRRIEAWDRAFSDPYDAIRYVPFDSQSFYFSDPDDRAAAEQIWMEAT